MRNLENSLLSRMASLAKVVGATILLVASTALTSSAAAPVNDNFTNATAIFGPAGSVSTSSVGATIEPGEPDPSTNSPSGASVWFLWTAPMSGIVSFNTSGSRDTTIPGETNAPLDTILAVYEGTNLTSLLPIAFNDDDLAGGTLNSRVDVTVKVGVTYAISVNGFGGAQGMVVLNWGRGFNAGMLRWAMDMESYYNAGNTYYGGTPGSIQYYYSDYDSWTAGHQTTAPIAYPRATVTRVGGANGRISVDWYLTNDWINYVLQSGDVFGTNWIVIVTDATGATNDVITNMDFTVSGTYRDDWGSDHVATNEFQMEASLLRGMYLYFYNQNNNPNEVCDNQEIGPIIPEDVNGVVITNSLGGTNYYFQKIYCFTQPAGRANKFTWSYPGAEAPWDYQPTGGTLYFNDYEMAKDIVFKDIFNPGYFRYENKRMRLVLTNAVLDTNEYTHIPPPTIDPMYGTAYVNLMSHWAAPNVDLASDRDSKISILNIERSFYRIGEGEKDIIVWVVREGNYASSVGCQVHVNYNWSYKDEREHHWPLMPHSDYALTNEDFAIFGETININDNTPGQAVAIRIPIHDDSKVEFNEDFRIELWKPTPDTGDSRAVLGYTSDANITILFQEQPAGAVDLTHNRDHYDESENGANLDMPGANRTVRALAVQPDGKTVIVGEFSDFNAIKNYGIARLKANGYWDPTFDTRGGADKAVNAVALDQSGNVVIGGAFTSIDGTNRYRIARLTPTGALDLSFDPGQGADGDVEAVAVQPDGKVIVGGRFTRINGITCPYIARLKNDGGIDPEFVPGDAANGPVLALAVSPTGKIAVGGEFQRFNNVPRKGIAQLNPDGSLDLAFDPRGGIEDGSVLAVTYQTDERILAGGSFTRVNLVNRPGVTRFDLNGLPDVTFDPGTGVDDVVYALALQPLDGKILIGGRFTMYNQTRRVGIARLWPSGMLDTTFMDTAYNQFAGIPNRYANLAMNAHNSVRAIGVEPSGDIMIGGSFNRVGGGGSRDDIRNRANVARLVGGHTPGPGNISFMFTNTYNVSEKKPEDQPNATRFIELTRTNGNLGPASVNFSTNTFSSSTGSAKGSDFGLKDKNSSITPTWPRVRDHWNWIIGYPYALDTRWIDPIDMVNQNVLGFMHSDGFTGPNRKMTPSEEDESKVWLNIYDNKLLDGDRDAGMSILYPNGTDMFFLGGVNIPLGVALGVSKGTLRILDDDIHAGVFSFTATNYWVNEGAGSVVITVQRTDGSTGAASIEYACVNGTAIAESPYKDYNKKSGRLDFADGQTNNTFPVTINNNTSNQLDRVFSVILFNPDKAALGSPSNAVVTIVDDDFQSGHLNFLSTNYVVSELSTSAVVTVTRTGGSKNALSVEYEAYDGTARSNINYQAVKSSLTWTNLDSSPRTFLVPVIHDSVITGNKTVNLRLFNPIVATLTNNPLNKDVLGPRSNAVLTIIDGDSYGTLEFRASNYRVMNNAGKVTITVLRKGGVDGEISVTAATLLQSNDTARLGFDFGGVTNRLFFAAGETAKTFDVPVYYNPPSAASLTFTVALIDPAPAVLPTTPLATVTIVNSEVSQEPAGSVDYTYLVGNGFRGFVQCMSLQQNGSLVVGGDFDAFNDFPRNRIARIDSDGVLDFDFLKDLDGADGTVYSVLAQDPSAGQQVGSILVGGNFSRVNGVNRKRIARLKGDGTIDETFNPGSGADNTVYSVVETLLPNGTNWTKKILIAGSFAKFNGVDRNGIARLNQDGTLDETFDPGMGVTGTNATILAMAVQANGQILIGGTFTAYNGTSRARIARLNANGSLDTTFNASTGIGGTVRAIYVQPDGKILIGGNFTQVNGTNFNYIARLNFNGTIDTTFKVGAGANAPVLALAVDTENRILVGGQFTSASGVTRNRLTRLLPDGTVDPGINFGEGADNFVSSIVLQSDEKIIVGGGFQYFDGYRRPNIARLFGGAMFGAGSLEFSAANYEIFENLTNAVVKVRRRGPTGTESIPTVTVDMVTSDDTARAGVDYTAVNTNMVFPLGETFASVTIPIIDNFVLDSNRVVNLALTNFDSRVAVGAQPIATLTILDDDCGISFQGSDIRVAEDVPGGKALIEIVRIGNLNRTSSVEVLTAGGTALPNVRYVPTNSIVTFSPGEAKKLFAVTILNDGLVIGDQTVGLEMINASGSVIIPPSSATLTIVEDDKAPGQVMFASSMFYVNENASNALITVVRTNGHSGSIAVKFGTSDGTAIAGKKYLSTNGSLSFADGEVIKSFTVPILNDTNSDRDMLVNLTLSEPSPNTSIIGTNPASLIIIDDEVGVSFATALYQASERSGRVVVGVERVGGTNSAFKVDYTTVDGTAVAGTNYTTTKGTLSYAPGQVLQTITVPILPDGVAVGDLDFFVALVSQTGTNAVQIAEPSLTKVVINDSDSGFRIAGTNTIFVSEKSSNVVVTVQRVGDCSISNTISIVTIDGTAESGTRYTAKTNVLVFNQGDVIQTFSVDILDKPEVEGDQTFSVVIYNPTGNAQLLEPSEAFITVLDDDTGVRFSSDNYWVKEGQWAHITIERFGATNIPVDVQYTIADDSAKFGINYRGTNGTAKFAVGQIVATIDVETLNDNQILGDLKVTLGIKSASNGAIPADPQGATLNIQECNGTLVDAAGVSLVSESFSPANGIIDPGETVRVLLGLRSVAGGNTTNLVAKLVTNANVISPIGIQQQTYGILVEKGHSVSREFTFTANATNGQHLTVSLQLQDVGGPPGLASYSFSVGQNIISFTNLGAIVINDSSNPPTMANPYPASMMVEGVPGLLRGVSVTLKNFNHTYPDDVDVLLVGPTGKKCVLMSRTGGGSIVNNVNLTFDDAATANLPDSTKLDSGTFKPTVYGNIGSTNFPAAPGAPYATNLSTFAGINPNGSWYLYVVDSRKYDAGVISNGWVLNLIYSDPVKNACDFELKAVDSPQATVSNLLTYTFSVTNWGPATATNVIFTNYFTPGRVVYLTNSLHLTNQPDANGMLTLRLPNLPSGNGLTFTVDVYPLYRGTVTNFALVGSAQLDPYSENSKATTITAVDRPKANIGVIAADDPDPVLLGNTVTYTINVTNIGPSMATGVMLTNELPQGVKLESVVFDPPPLSLTTNGRVIIAHIDDLLPLARCPIVTARIVVRPLVAGVITNNVMVGSDVADPWKSNNSIEVKTDVKALPLSLAPSINGCVIRWPVVSGYILEKASSLQSPVQWVPITNPAPGRVGEEYVLPVSYSDESGFYRLRKP